MANLFFRGEKAPQQEAINSLTLKISEYYGGRYEVRVASDDGGHHLEIQIEVLDPSEYLHTQVAEFPPLFEIVPKWEGWRTIILKVPVGYIDAITNREEGDDY
jgi:hypothetical protein